MQENGYSLGRGENISYGTDTGGGGGSGFVSGMIGCKAVDASGNPIDGAAHYSGLIFRDTEMSVGVNAGNGKIKITLCR